MKTKNCKLKTIYPTALTFVFAIHFHFYFIFLFVCFVSLSRTHKMRNIYEKKRHTQESIFIWVYVRFFFFFCNARIHFV